MMQSSCWQLTRSCASLEDRKKVSMCYISFILQCCFWRCTSACQNREGQHALNFLHGAMLFLAMHLHLCFRKNSHVLAFIHDSMQSFFCNALVFSFMMLCSCFQWICFCAFLHDRRKARMCYISFTVQCCFWKCTCASYKESQHVLAFLHDGVQSFLAMHLCFSLRCNIVVRNGLVLVLSFMIKGKLAYVTFLSRCNVVFGNTLVFVL